MKEAFSLIRLRPRSESLFVSDGRSVLITDTNGFVQANSRHGFFAYETRLLSRYEYQIDGKPLHPVALSNVSQNSWLGYYIFDPPGQRSAPQDRGSGSIQSLTENTLEVRISRFIENGMHEDLHLVNYSPYRTSFTLQLHLDADFAGFTEMKPNKKAHHGKLQIQWKNGDAKLGELHFDYCSEHAYNHQGEKGTAQLHRGIRTCVSRADSPPHYRNRTISFKIGLAPLCEWRACLDLIPLIDGTALPAATQCRSFTTENTVHERQRLVFRESSTKVKLMRDEHLTSVASGAIQQAARDLEALRLHDLDQGPHAWTVAAGLPLYIALFGRDTLTAAWQASILTKDLLRGTLPVLSNLQGIRINDWRDEQPGRMLHEAHTDPLSVLNFVPRERYYGSATTSAFYPVAVSLLWHWTGDKSVVAPFIEPSLKAFDWVSRYGDTNGDGFYDYKSRSKMGVQNQGWKDSGDAIVYEDGKVASSPIAMCEEQAFIYQAKTFFSELLWNFDRKDEAKRLFLEARELKKRFNEAFWMPDAGYVAMGLDAKSRQIRSIGSDPGHCIACGILDDSLVRRVADRMFSPGLFSGWGVRTLSSDHPAYDPYSYHRGSVWPVEHGTFCAGFARYGLTSHLERICRAQFEAAGLFDFYRLPELFTGHARDEEHPFPALYPAANSPQAWSASTVFCMLQSLLGLHPYAPLKLLLVDPQLPEWLPEVILSGLNVGDAVLNIRFYRKLDGSSDYEVQDLRGKLHVIRQASPWSLTSHFADRIKDMLSSLIPGGHSK